MARLDRLVFFTNLNLLEFQLKYLAAICFFSETDTFQWLWMGNLIKTQLLLFDWSDDTFVIDVNMDGSVLEIIS